MAERSETDSSKGGRFAAGAYVRIHPDHAKRLGWDGQGRGVVLERVPCGVRVRWESGQGGAYRPDELVPA